MIEMSNIYVTTVTSCAIYIQVGIGFTKYQHLNLKNSNQYRK